MLDRAFKVLFSGWSLLLFIKVGITESNTIKDAQVQYFYHLS